MGFFSKKISRAVIKIKIAAWQNRYAKPQDIFNNKFISPN
jgi:hypothetical protein